MPVNAQLPNTNDAILTQSPTDSRPLSSASRLDWSGGWAAGLDSYDQNDELHDSMQALVWSSMHSDFTSGTTLSESLNAVNPLPFGLSSESAPEVQPHSPLTICSNNQARRNGAEKQCALVEECINPLNEPAPDTSLSGDAASSSGPVFSDIQSPLPDIPSLPTLIDYPSVNASAITSPPAEHRPRSTLTTEDSVRVNMFPPVGISEVVCIDELQFVHVVCQLVESLQDSITTQVRVLDLLLSMGYKTVKALGTLVQVRSGRKIKISPHCLALLYSCMFQVVELATQGRDCLREELATESRSSVSGKDAILNSLDFAGFSSDASHKRLWRAQRAAERLDSVTQEVRAILITVSSTSPNTDGGQDDNTRTCLEGIVMSLEHLVQAYREMSRP